MTPDQVFQMFSGLLESPPSGIFTVTPGKRISISNVRQMGDVTLVYPFGYEGDFSPADADYGYSKGTMADYLYFLDTLPWWEGDNEPHFQNG